MLLACVSTCWLVNGWPMSMGLDMCPQRLVVERDQLKESVEELRFSQLQQPSTSTEGEVPPIPNNSSVTAAAPDNIDPLNLK
jgi:hypothetical protein